MFAKVWRAHRMSAEEAKDKVMVWMVFFVAKNSIFYLLYAFHYELNFYSFIYHLESV